MKRFSYKVVRTDGTSYITSPLSVKEIKWCTDSSEVAQVWLIKKKTS